ncbi:signal recognition particle protein [Helicobacter sp. faydin-H20]|uniref:signal recognition particle protein n=1 Tax=Helicobacter anatolicus TaxID=2905874 RepID=UPI001E4079EB|nr:signal recognition particle protein [Helicobacter anatolicus]MCE3036585.1 signal recognition particle protein [Helicobacter anatolicus]
MFDTLGSTFRNIVGKIRFSDDEKSLSRALDELKKSLLKNDVHHKVTKEIIQQVESQTKAKGIGRQNFLDSLQNAILSILQTSKSYGFVFANKPPTTILMAGLQGSGKTTTSAKLANYLKTKNKKVLLAACDLQRLAAIKQLKQLGEQIEVEVFSIEENHNPISIAKLAKQKAIESHFDVLIIDTAGRLAIDEDLMQELQQIKEAITPDEIFYVADSLSGQDGVRTAASFNEKLDLSGVILSKFDSDSKGGIALSIAYQIGLPLRFIGTGEKIPDFDIFIPDRIVSRLMGAGDIASLAEKTASIIDQKEAKTLTKKIKKGQFTFMDFIAQIENIKKLGSMSSIISMIPGLGGMAGALKNVDLDNSVEIKNIKAMVNSMTPKERENPDLLNGSRRKRIAQGSGLEVSDINRLIKQFDNAAKMAKKFSNKASMQELMSMMGQMQNFKR